MDISIKRLIKKVMTMLIKHRRPLITIHDTFHNSPITFSNTAHTNDYAALTKLRGPLITIHGNFHNSLIPSHNAAHTKKAWGGRTLKGLLIIHA